MNSTHISHQLCSLIFKNTASKTTIQDLYLNQILVNNVSIWFYLIGCSISLILDTFLFVVFLYKNQLRQSPGDIFLGSFVFEIIMAIQWYIIAVSSYEDKPLANNSLECQFTAALTLISHLGQYFYILAFFYFLTRQVKTSFKAKNNIQWLIHLGVIILTLITCVIVFSLNLTGKNVDGKCSIVTSLLADYVITLGYTLTILIYISIGGYSIYYIKKNIPNQYKERAQKFLKFSIIYFLTYLILIFAAQLVELLASLSCTYQWNMNLNAMYDTAAFFDIMILILLPIIRVNDPYTKRILLKMFGYGQKQKQIIEENELELSKHNSSVDQDLSILTSGISQIRQSELIINREKSQTDDNPFVSVLQNKKRGQIMCKMIAGLQIDQYSKYNSLEVEIINQKSDNIYEERKIYKFNNDQIITTMPYNLCQDFVSLVEDFPQIKVVSYTPIIFHAIMNREKEKLNIYESLDINNNFEKITNASKNEGGKSGQFFFYSQDNQLIIKTVTQQELKIILTMLKNYFQYILSNPNTLIAKIYGVYTFEQENQKNINIIVMRNIAQTSNTFRIYDLKGSSYDREVAKKDTNLQKVVLKDLDFLNIEKYLYISQEDASLIAENAIKDSNFFKSQGLIDYSLIVFKILNEQNPDLIPKKKANIFMCDDVRYRYHIGIIDYLQEYNVQKQFEKYTKKIIKLNQNLDTSSQDPKIYANRFQQFIRRITKIE
ncbi:unnamed protein product (macronuclear) [Paramecium tetraurelia]|uniref:PIPK domain-containing protein n=1 Tax=Paramecium tetraurelia TaxID=5888 RepID=A0DRY7_PARTE|nr:uncharacterized protein GSPATT00019508001 [Paramecium tetraurelia]CAK85804.1 unnamed protein product [Paramecium tetraurelia]|eukprot:XP_001453201.1 hypothetical protein (macronuclear) [Paramecium tetraurelia strain d4-2]